GRRSTKASRASQSPRCPGASPYPGQSSHKCLVPPRRKSGNLHGILVGRGHRRPSIVGSSDVDMTSQKVAMRRGAALITVLLAMLTTVAVLAPSALRAFAAPQ